ncbi:hypothetical protein KEJ19_00425 [Candidatus Bathyarchaeota archaeon]|nr:hypothetical protein [Candidatus Bathyarchaeota archaeon]
MNELVFEKRAWERAGYPRREALNLEETKEVQTFFSLKKIKESKGFFIKLILRLIPPFLL